MNVQAIERTLIDKVFAICDYFLENKSRRLSRHIYDIHMIFPKVNFEDNLKSLTKKVRKIRSDLAICPSAKADIDINSLLKKICDTDFYKNDFDGVTRFFIFDNVKYKETKSTLQRIIDSGMFNA